MTVGSAKIPDSLRASGRDDTNEAGVFKIFVRIGFVVTS